MHSIKLEMKKGRFDRKQPLLLIFFIHNILLTFSFLLCSFLLPHCLASFLHFSLRNEDYFQRFSNIKPHQSLPTPIKSQLSRDRQDKVKIHSLCSKVSIPPPLLLLLVTHQTAKQVLRRTVIYFHYPCT